MLDTLLCKEHSTTQMGLEFVCSCGYVLELKVNFSGRTRKCAPLLFVNQCVQCKSAYFQEYLALDLVDLSIVVAPNFLRGDISCCLVKPNEEKLDKRRKVLNTSDAYEFVTSCAPCSKCSTCEYLRLCREGNSHVTSIKNQILNGGVYLNLDYVEERKVGMIKDSGKLKGSWTDTKVRKEVVLEVPGQYVFVEGVLIDKRLCRESKSTLEFKLRIGKWVEYPVRGSRHERGIILDSGYGNRDRFIRDVFNIERESYIGGVKEFIFDYEDVPPSKITFVISDRGVDSEELVVPERRVLLVVNADYQTRIYSGHSFYQIVESNWDGLECILKLNIDYSITPKLLPGTTKIFR